MKEIESSSISMQQLWVYSRSLCIIYMYRYIRVYSYNNSSNAVGCADLLALIHFAWVGWTTVKTMAIE